MGRPRELPKRHSVLGSRVAKAREALGWKLVDLAGTCGIAHTTLSRIEGGHIQQIRCGPLMRIALALRVSTDYLLGRSALPSVPASVERDPMVRYAAEAMGELPEEKRRMVVAFVDGLRGQPRTGRWKV